MKKFIDYFKREKTVNPVRNSCPCGSKQSGASDPAPQQRAILFNGMKAVLLLGVYLLVSFPSYAGSIREISRSMRQVQSIEPPFQFAVIGDSQRGQKIYAQLVKRILERKPKFLIHLGDMINEPDEKEWQTFFETSKQMDFPFFPVTGNHDVGTTKLGEEIYRKQFSFPDGRTHYSFRAGGGLFVILDSEKGRGRILNEQWSWLENILSTSAEDFKFVFIHRPLFLPVDSLKMGRAMDKYPLERDYLHRLFLKAKVRAVFAGDDHRYDRREKEGILYLISGGGGGPLTALKERGGYFHYVWISVEKGRIEGEVVDLEGKVQDRFVIEP